MDESQKTNRPSRYHVDVLGKGLDILDALKGSRADLRLTEIAEKAGLDISTTFRLLHTLELRSYVIRDQKNKKYKLSLGFRKYRIGYAQMAGDHPFVQKVTEGLLQAAETSHVEIVLADNKHSPEEAVRSARWLVSQRVDFMIEYNFHYCVTPMLADMFSKANIPCLAIDIPQPGAIYFGADNYSAGFLGGRELALFAARKWAGNVDRVLMLEIPEAGPVPQSRVLGTLEGMRDVLPKLSDRIIAHKNGKATEAGGYTATRRLISKLGPGEHLLIVAANDNSARGAVRAVRETKRTKFTAIIALAWGPDKTLEAELRKPGSPLVGAVAYFPESYGAALLPIVLNSLSGQPVPPAVYCEHALVTRAFSI